MDIDFALIFLQIIIIIITDPYKCLTYLCTADLWSWGPQRWW